MRSQCRAGLKKLVLEPLIKKFSDLNSKQPAIEPHPEPVKSSSHHHTLFFLKTTLRRILKQCCKNVPIIFAISVRPSLLMQQFKKHSTDFHEILFWGRGLTKHIPILINIGILDDVITQAAIFQTPH
jgi:hypothetical protein